jgi:3-oxoacyl-[acyl-carrier protein] reductase
MELRGKTAIVTGSGRGIGEGIAVVLAREGANLVINDRKITSDAEGVVKKIKAMGGKAIAVEADISKKNEVTAMAEQAVREFGAIDILVNNAGIESHPVMTTIGRRDWDRVLVNLKGRSSAVRRDSANDQEEEGPHHQHHSTASLHRLFRRRQAA